MPPIVKELHPLATNHILSELKEKGKIDLDQRDNPKPIATSIKGSRKDGATVYSVDGQPITHIVHWDGWLFSAQFETLVYPEGIADLMAEVIDKTSPAVIAEIEDSLKTMGHKSPWW